jgi:hypothetical protein
VIAKYLNAGNSFLVVFNLQSNVTERFEASLNKNKIEECCSNQNS